MKLLLLSDLHAFSTLKRNAEEPSYLKVSGASSGLSSRKIGDEFLALLKRDNIKADYLVCCGDLANQADEKGLEYAWKFINEVKTASDAKELIVTAGNHDVDSRFRTSKGAPTEFLKALTPGFPSDIEAEFQAFWADAFYIRDQDNVRFLVINTAAAHGYRNEHEHGLISERILGKLETILPGLPEKPVNICVCHHHPHRHCELGLGDFDDIKNGQLLLDILAAPGCGQWLVLHGHKHHPRLSYAQGCSLSTTVFSAGSLAARLYPTLQERARNQFYLIDISVSEVQRFRRLLGEFQAWSWFAAEGWMAAGDRDGLPARGGFGFRDIHSLCSRMADELPFGKTEWIAAVMQFPELRFVSPADMQHLRRCLREHSIGVGDGQIYPAFFTRTPRCTP